MKHNLITLTALSASLIASAALVGCQREAIGPDAQASALDPAADEIVIPVSVEPTRYDDTKVSLDGSTGACTWEDGDLVALYINGKNAYVSSGIVGSAVRLSIGSTDSRAKYAIYPYASADLSGCNTPTVIYPDSYDMYGRNTATYCPAPMVADNTQDALEFYHVGGVLRLHLLNVPTGATGFTVTFSGMNAVRGTFSVSHASGLASATTTVTGSDANTVTFTNVTASSEMFLNIPLPTQNYSSLNGISVTTTGLATNYTATTSVSGWGLLSHGQGRKVTVDYVSITHGAGYTGKFRSVFISPGVLKWEGNPTTGHYTIDDGSDPLILLKQYGKSDALNVYYHQWMNSSNPMCLKKRLDDNYTAEDFQHATIVIDGLDWRIGARQEWAEVLTGYSGTYYKGVGGVNFTCPTVNGATNNTKYFHALVLINLSDATISNGAAEDYTGEGITTVVNDAVTTTIGTGTGYQAGILLFPDGAIISCPSIKETGITNFHKNVLTFRELKKLLDGGCLFIPAVGMNNGSNWVGGGYSGTYWTATNIDNTSSRRIVIGDNSIATNNDQGMSSYAPVFLIR